MKDKNIKKIVKEGYAKIAATNSSCCVESSCCSGTNLAETSSKNVGYKEKELKTVPEGANLGLGCGNPVAMADIREGEAVLDIGSGGGLDVFLASKRVGPKGKVIGLDITAQMVKRAKQNAKKGNYNNVEFKLADAEDIPVKDNSIDLVMSNCVINLVPNKEKVYREIYRVLKPGGRFIVSDLVTEKKLDESINNNPEKLVACVSGALTEKGYFGAIKKAGFKKVRIINKSSMIVSGVNMLSETIKGEKR